MVVLSLTKFESQVLTWNPICFWQKKKKKVLLCPPLFCGCCFEKVIEERERERDPGCTVFSLLGYKLEKFQHPSKEGKGPVIPLSFFCVLGRERRRRLLPARTNSHYYQDEGFESLKSRLCESPVVSRIVMLGN